MPSIFIYKYRISHSSEIIIIYLDSEFSQNFLDFKQRFFFFGLSLRFKEISNISTNTDIVAPGQQFNSKMTPTNIWQSVWVWLACSNLWSKLDRDFLGQVASHQASCAINLQCVIIFNQTESRGWMVLQPLGNQMFATTICNVITQQSTIFPSFKDVAVFFFYSDETKT